MVSAYAADPATHPAKTAPGDWYACEQPERPNDVNTVWAGPCRACRLHLAATMHNDSDSVASPMVDLRPDGRAVEGAFSLARGALVMADRFDDPILAGEAREAVERFNG